MRGRKPIPSALGKPAPGEPVPPDACPRCPSHLSAVARKEWRRLATPLYRMGVLTVADRAALAAYCQAYARWVEAEEQLARTPPLIKTPSGYVQQSPWLSIANKQLEIMGRYMAELGLTPAARRRVQALVDAGGPQDEIIIRRTIYEARPGDAPRLVGQRGPGLIEDADVLVAGQDADGEGADEPEKSPADQAP